MILQAVSSNEFAFHTCFVVLQGSGFVKLTRKASLIMAAASLPKAISDVKEAMLVPGYITNITNDACYVRFLGQLTGRAGLAQLADLFVSDPSAHYHVGQSVRAQVVQVRGAASFVFTPLLLSEAHPPSDWLCLGRWRFKEMPLADHVFCDVFGRADVMNRGIKSADVYYWCLLMSTRKGD